MKIKVAAIQAAFSTETDNNVDRMIEMSVAAALGGAQIILLPELFENIYFCTFEDDKYFSLARPLENHPTVQKFQRIAKEFKVAIPVSFFEKNNHEYYNSVAMIDADGSVMGLYRKSHIPDGPGYEEKYYFRPGNTGFKVWNTRYGNIGVGICWDQWFPECARSMVLQGADILLYPTAIGTEPQAPDFDTKDLWQRAMIGHAVSNVVPVVAANRIGKEPRQSFYGHSFICDHRGEKVSELDRVKSGIISAEFDFSVIRRDRVTFAMLRDRRPELYSGLTRTTTTEPQLRSTVHEVQGHHRIRPKEEDFRFDLRSRYNESSALTLDK